MVGQFCEYVKTTDFCSNFYWIFWVPWTARRSNLSILKEINPEYPVEGLMLKHWFIGKDPDAGKDWGQKEKGATEDVMVG